MEQVNLTGDQQIVLDHFRKHPNFPKLFYFTGGTALAIYYYHHRLSVDLDFFSEKKFSARSVNMFIASLEKKFGWKWTLRQPDENILVYTADTSDGLLKIDFNFYPYKRLNMGKIIDGIDVDSLQDIAANKLLTINQRSDVKDFVDLYYLLKDFTVWDLMYAVEVKFRFKLDPVMVAADFLKIEQFDILPKMKKPLTLAKLTTFYKKQARVLGSSFIR